MPLKIEITILLAGAVATTIIGYCIWRIKRREKVFVKVAKVTKLYHYPIKSLKGVLVPELECTRLGVKYLGILDRSFMLVSDDNVLVSQRQEPRMTLLSVSIFKDHIAIMNLDGKTLKISLKDVLKEDKVIKDCKIHRSQIKTIDCGDEAAEFFQDFLGRKDIRLVRYENEYSTRRYLGNVSLFHKLLKGSPSTLQDFAPFHLVSKSSVNELNTKLEKDVSELNFRPNVLVDGATAFDEDNWEHIQFSSGAILDVLLPCGRCILTTNDPETGIKTNKDPLSTLRKFRMAKDKKLSKALDHSPLFGIDCWLQKGGKISVGDDLFAVIKKGHFACEG